jgi:hypothetical protein
MDKTANRTYFLMITFFQAVLHQSIAGFYRAYGEGDEEAFK